MKKKLVLVSIFTVILLFVGAIIYKTPFPQWKELSCGLWINKNGNIGLKTTKAVDDAKFITNPHENSGLSKISLYLDSFFWDLNYVFTKYCEGTLDNISLIYGDYIISDMNNGEESHYAKFIKKQCCLFLSN